MHNKRTSKMISVFRPICRKMLVAALMLLLPLTQAVLPAMAQVAAATEGAIEGTLLLQLSGAGPSGQSISLNFPGGPVQTVRMPSNGNFLLEAVPMGQPEELTGTIRFQTRGGTTTINMVWNRYDQTIVFNGRSTPNAVLNISGAVTGSLRANGSGYFQTGSAEQDLELDAGDFMGEARSISIAVTPYYYSGRTWRAERPISVGVATNLPEDPAAISPSFAPDSTGAIPAASGGGGGGGSSIVGGVVKAALVTAAMSALSKLFSSKSLTADLGPKIEKKWIDTWRGMSQQNTTSKQKVIQTESTIADASQTNEAASEAGQEQTENAEELASTPQLCQVASTTVGAAAAEHKAQENQDKLVEKTAANPDAADLGQASRNCRYANSVNNPEFKKMCEDAGLTAEIVPGSVVTDPTATAESNLDATASTPTDTARQAEAYVDLVTGENRQLQGVGAAARDPNSFAAVLNARAVSATESLIKASLTRTIAMNARGTGAGADTLRATMQALGYPTEFIDSKVGTNPSYATQLEVATKLAYQDPNFYIGLEGLSEPQLRAINAGVTAQSAAQWREIYLSVRSRELLLATILEAKIREKQRLVAGQLAGTDTR